jgi:hypothetical protein
MAVGWEPIGAGSPSLPVPGAGGPGESDGDGPGESDGDGPGESDGDGPGESDGDGPGAWLVHVPSDQTHPRDVQSFSPVQSLHSAHLEPPESPPVTNLWTSTSINTTAIKPPIHSITRVVLLILAISFL